MYKYLPFDWSAQIFLYNDTKDTGTILGYNSSDITTIYTQNLTWIRVDFNDSAAEVEMTMYGENRALFAEGGLQMRVSDFDSGFDFDFIKSTTTTTNERIFLFSTQLKCYGHEDHDVDFPHLLHSTNVTQIDFEFIDLNSRNHSFPSTRLAAEFVLVADENKSKPFQVSERKTLDDEHTPGIFKLIDITSPESFLGSRGNNFAYVFYSTFLSLSIFYSVLFFLFSFPSSSPYSRAKIQVVLLNFSR